MGPILMPATCLRGSLTRLTFPACRRGSALHEGSWPPQQQHSFGGGGGEALVPGAPLSTDELRLPEHKGVRKKCVQRKSHEEQEPRIVLESTANVKLGDRTAPKASAQPTRAKRPRPPEFLG